MTDTKAGSSFAGKGEKKKATGGMGELGGLLARSGLPRPSRFPKKSEGLGLAKGGKSKHRRIRNQGKPSKHTVDLE